MKPPIAGPATVAISKEVADQVIAVGSVAVGTNNGGKLVREGQIRIRQVASPKTRR